MSLPVSDDLGENERRSCDNNLPYISRGGERSSGGTVEDGPVRLSAR